MFKDSPMGSGGVNITGYGNSGGDIRKEIGY
jgi:hypothetical protein